MFKPVLTILALLLLLIGCGGQDEKAEEKPTHDQYVIDYFQKIGGIRQNVENAMISLNTAIQSGDTVLMNTNYSQLMEKIDKSIEQVKAAGPLYDDHTLQQSLLKLLAFYREIMSGPYIESLTLQKKNDKEFSDNDMLRCYEILDSISKKQAIIVKEFDDQLLITGEKFKTIIQYKN